MDKLASIKKPENHLTIRQLSPEMKKKLISDYSTSSERLILLDYDGTLTPIVEDPEKAFLPPKYRKVIGSLLRNEKNFVCIISGRAIEQLEGFIRLKGLVLAGNHGMQIAGPDIFYVNDEALRAKALLGEIAQMLQLKLRGFEGVLVEDEDLNQGRVGRDHPELPYPRPGIQPRLSNPVVGDRVRRHVRSDQRLDPRLPRVHVPLDDLPGRRFGLAPGGLAPSVRPCHQLGDPGLAALV